MHAVFSLSISWEFVLDEFIYIYKLVLFMFNFKKKKNIMNG